MNQPKNHSSISVYSMCIIIIKLFNNYISSSPHIRIVSVTEKDTPASSSPQISSTEDAPHYAEANIVSENNMAAGTTSYSIAAVCLTIPPGREGALEEFPRSQLTFKEKLGEGQFGEVRASLQAVAFQSEPSQCHSHKGLSQWKSVFAN